MITTERIPAPNARQAADETGALSGQRVPTTQHDDGSVSEVRLALSDATSADATRLDGAWWPRSRSLPAELPALIAHLHRSGIRITRVTYNPQCWDQAPRRLAADGRIIRLGWFTSIDPHLLSLTDAYGAKRLDLLVVPPDTTAAAAERVSTAAAGGVNRETPTEVLRAAGALPTASPPQRTAAAHTISTDGAPASVSRGRSGDRLQIANWETDGGRVSVPWPP